MSYHLYNALRKSSKILKNDQNETDPIRLPYMFAVR